MRFARTSMGSFAGLASAALVSSFAGGCAPVSEQEPDPDDDEPPPKVYEPLDGDLVVGEERPVTVFVPDSYDPAEPLPFLFLLHGYGFTGAQMDSLLDFNAVANDTRFFYARPEGTVDSDGSQFWNATDTCCDFEGTGVDDSAFLRGVVEEAMETANIDPGRIFVVGHSNGGFMAQRLACDHADLFAAVASIAGATSREACEPSEGVAVLAVHGTSDATIAYNGGSLAPGLVYPSAEDTAQLWAARNDCNGDATEIGTLDLETIAGAETTITRHENCRPGGAAELWTVAGGTHVPRGTPGYVDLVLGFLFDHARE